LTGNRPLFKILIYFNLNKGFFVEARFISNNSLAKLNDDLNFINDLLLKPKPENIHFRQLEYTFQNLSSRVNQFVLEYNVNKDLSFITNTKEALQKLDVTFKTGIKNLETGNKQVIPTTFTFMNNNSWVHIDFSKEVSKGLVILECDASLLNKDVITQSTILKENPELIANIILDVNPVVACELGQNIPNSNLEKLKILCGRETSMFRYDSIILLDKLKSENDFANGLKNILDKLGDFFGIDRFMINNLLTKKTTLETDWECKTYLFDVLMKRGELDPYTFSSFIKSASEHHQYGEAKKAFEIAKLNPRYLNSFIYFAIITAAIDNKEFKDADLLIKEAMNKKILSSYTKNVITGQLAAAREK